MALIASKDESRPNLNYVQVRRVAGETYWLATDGRRAGILHDSGQLELYPKPDEYGDITFELPVPRFSLFGLRDKEGRNTLRFDMDTEAVPEHEADSKYYKGVKNIVPVSGWCDWSANGITQRIKMPKLQPYLDLMKVVPERAFGKSESFTFNPEYVLDAQRVANVALGLKCVGTTVSQYGETVGVLCVRVMDALYYIVMPMRIDRNSNTMPPDWLKNLRPAPVAPPAPVEPVKVETPEPPKPV